MDDRELSDAEWQLELRAALVAFERARWRERRARTRDGDQRDPWMT